MERLGLRLSVDVEQHAIRRFAKATDAQSRSAKGHPDIWRQQYCLLGFLKDVSDVSDSVRLLGMDSLCTFRSGELEETTVHSRR